MKSGSFKSGKEVVNNCDRWEEWGGRYCGYISHFHGNNGVVFALDFKISRINWEHDVPTDGSERELFLQIQADRSLLRVANVCKNAADQVVEYADNLTAAWFEQTQAADLNSSQDDGRDKHIGEKRKRTPNARKEETKTKTSVFATRQDVAATAISYITERHVSPAAIARMSRTSDQASSISRDHSAPSDNGDNSAPCRLERSVSLNEQSTTEILSQHRVQGHTSQSGTVSSETNSTPRSTGLAPSPNRTQSTETVNYVPARAQLQEEQHRIAFASREQAPMNPQSSVRSQSDNCRGQSTRRLMAETAGYFYQGNNALGVDESTTLLAPAVGIKMLFAAAAGSSNLPSTLQSRRGNWQQAHVDTAVEGQTLQDGNAYRDFGSCEHNDVPTMSLDSTVPGQPSIGEQCSNPPEGSQDRQDTWLNESEFQWPHGNGFTDTDPSAPSGQDTLEEASEWIGAYYRQPSQVWDTSAV
ncbi:hypothetical protein TruAng_012307 [Truncatella angustata]|nr:hypothetical protein TruAng_012307 [Truncatella angustata]